MRRKIVKKVAQKVKKSPAKNVAQKSNPTVETIEGRCPGCEKNAQLTSIPTESNTDPMGRRQYVCSNGHNLVRHSDGILSQVKEGTVWNSNIQQFPRLLAEIRGVGLVREQLEALAESMGFDNEDEIYEILERAEFVWEQDKDLMFNPGKARWVVQSRDGIHIEDTKTGALIDMTTTFKPSLDRHIAKSIAYFLNTDARTR